MTLPAMQPIAPFTPWPYEDGATVRADGLDISCKIEGADGVWFDLEDGEHYVIHGDSFTEYSQTYRTRSVNSEWIEGSFPVSSVRESVTEQLVVMVRGQTQGELRLYQQKLTDAIEQLSWQLMVRFDEVAEYWQCSAADYAVQTQREYRHARLSIVRATVPRLPAKLLVDATSDEV